jgi:hypothetical protein
MPFDFFFRIKLLILSRNYTKIPCPPEVWRLILSAMGVCFQTRGLFQQGSGKIDWARRPGCTTVISNGITKAPDLPQRIRPLTGRLNSISEGDAFSGLKTDTHGAFTYIE